VHRLYVPDSQECPEREGPWGYTLGYDQPRHSAEQLANSETGKKTGEQRPTVKRESSGKQAIIPLQKAVVHKRATLAQQ